MDGRKVTVVMPVFNDWDACRLLLTRLDAVLARRYRSVAVLIVDDGSTIRDGPSSLAAPYVCIEPIVLQLRRNLGHQRAICIGLAYVHDVVSADFTVVMDSDGEDSAEDVPRLLDQAEQSRDCIVFARRTKRSESYSFRIGYGLFRLLHRLATGHDISFGNFSVLPRARLASLVTVGDLWNNYAASVLVSKQPHLSIPTQRATRLDGKPQMKLLSLVAHGLGAISVFGEIVAVRCASVGLVATAACAGLLIVSIVGLLPLSMPALVSVAVMTLGALQLFAFALLFAFITLSRRSAAVFQPTMNYQQFVERAAHVDDTTRAGTGNARGT